jgi:hypothetical protein
MPRGGKKHISSLLIRKKCSEECDKIESELEEVYWLIKELGLPYEIGKVNVTTSK